MRERERDSEKRIRLKTAKKQKGIKFEIRKFSAGRRKRGEENCR